MTEQTAVPVPARYRVTAPLITLRTTGAPLASVRSALRLDYIYAGGSFAADLAQPDHLAALVRKGMVEPLEVSAP